METVRLVKLPPLTGSPDSEYYIQLPRTSQVIGIWLTDNCVGLWVRARFYAADQNPIPMVSCAFRVVRKDFFAHTEGMRYLGTGFWAEESWHVFEVPRL